MRLRDSFVVKAWQRDTVQSHLRRVSPRLFEIPEFDTFERTSAGEFDDVVTSSEYAAADYAVLGGAITEVHHQAIEKDGLAANPQLNGAKNTIVTDDLDSAAVLAAVDLGGTQEIPKLSAGV